MIKVLHFFKTYYPDTMGGIEQVICQLAEGGIEEGIESEVLYLSARGAARDERYKHHRTHRVNLDLNVASTGMSLSALKRFVQLARQADVIHYHFPWPFMDIIHFLARLKKPTVVTYHSDIVKQKTLLALYSPLMHKFLSSVDVIVASSPNYVASSSVLARFAEKVKVIPFGLDRTAFSKVNAARSEYWRDRLGGRFFLFVGALRYYKGLEFLVEAAALTSCQIVIAGGGPQEETLKARVEELNLSNVKFVGLVSDDDKDTLLELCTGFVFPSHLRSEAFGISLLEGAMYAKPMISCEIGTGTSYINIDGETGYVVRPENPNDLAKAMDRLWSDSSLCDQLGKNALARAEQYFGVREMVKSYSDIYKSLVSQTHS